MTAKHGIHLPGGVSIIDEDFLEPVSLYLQNSYLSSPYEIKIGDRIAQTMIEKVQPVKWVEGIEDDFNLKKQMKMEHVIVLLQRKSEIEIASTGI